MLRMRNINKRFIYHPGFLGRSLEILHLIPWGPLGICFKKALNFHVSHIFYCISVQGIYLSFKYMKTAVKSPKKKICKFMRTRTVFVI